MAIRIGSASPRDTHDSKEVERLSQGTATTYRLNGDYDALAAMMPAPGEDWRDGKVTSSRLRRLQGGVGILEVVVAPSSSSSSSSSGDDKDTPPVTEIEMAQTERSIMSRPDFNGYVGVIEAWRGSPPELRAEYKYLTPRGNGGETAVESLQGNAREAARLILSGIECYLVFHPVVTVTTVTKRRPTSYGDGIGKRGSSRGAGAPAGYDYLKTADRLTHGTDGKWTRVQQWTGAALADGGWEKTLYD